MDFSFLEKVEGFLRKNEAKLLYKLAKNAKKGAIVEIGSYKGKSAICLAKGSKDGKKLKVYAIDPHLGSSEHKINKKDIWTYDEFKKNIKKAKVNDLVIPIVKHSKDASKNFKKKISLLFIDGAHEYGHVKQDFESWEPKLMDGGIIAFHDSFKFYDGKKFEKGPEKLIKEMIYKSGNFSKIKSKKSITYAVKEKSHSQFSETKYFFQKNWSRLFYWHDVLICNIKQLIQKCTKSQ